MLLILLAALPMAQDRSYGREPGDWLRRGSALMRAERFTDAEAVLQSIAAANEDFPAAQTLLGYLYLRRSALDPSTRAFEQALNMEPGNAAARFGLGVALSRKGLLEEAAGQFERVFDDPSLKVKARSQWLQTLFWSGKVEEPSAEARRLADEFPTIAEYQSLAGFFSHVRGEAEAARRFFERALEIDPARISDYFSLVSICRAQGDWDGALYWIRKATELDPNQPLLYEELATVYAKLGKSREAEKARDEAGRTMEAEVLYARSVRARVGGRPMESEELLRRCLQANPRLAKAWADLGEAAREDKRPGEALRMYRRALEIDPSNLLARLGAAAALQEHAESAGIPVSGETAGIGRKPARPSGTAAQSTDQEEFRAAASLLLRTVQDYPDHADLLAYLGRVQEASGNPQAAMESFSEALRIDPLEVRAILGKAKLFLDSGDAQRAAGEFRRAADLEPANLQTWRGLVQACRQAGNTRAAETAGRQCLEHNPGDPDCLELLAYLKMDQEDYRSAAGLFQTILRGGRASKDLLDSQGFARMKLGETKEAIGLFESSLKRYGQDSWVYFNLGYLYQSQGNIPSAIANYRRARQLSPQDPECNHNLAFALYLAKDYAGALKPFKAAVRLQPDWGLAHFNLAMDYWNLRQYAQALTHARIAEQKGLPGSGRVVQALSDNLSLGTPRTITVYRPRK